jgi:hypothetical protein
MSQMQNAATDAGYFVVDMTAREFYYVANGEKRLAAEMLWRLNGSPPLKEGVTHDMLAAMPNGEPLKHPAISPILPGMNAYFLQDGKFISDSNSRRAFKMQNGKKRAFASWDHYLRFNPNSVGGLLDVILSDVTIDSIADGPAMPILAMNTPEGTIPDGTVIYVSGWPFANTYWRLEGGFKRKMQKGDFSNAVQFNKAEVNLIPDGPDIIDEPVVVAHQQVVSSPASTTIMQTKTQEAKMPNQQTSVPTTQLVLPPPPALITTGQKMQNIVVPAQTPASVAANDSNMGSDAQTGAMSETTKILLYAAIGGTSIVAVGVLGYFLYKRRQ